jgi:hypothetical protein
LKNLFLDLFSKSKSRYDETNAKIKHDKIVK